MSRSPRKSLRQAAHALDQFISVIGEHPEARREVVDSVGEEGVREVERLRDQIHRLAERLTGDTTA
jgi:hypothetical protein